MTTVKNLLDEKGHIILSVSPDTLVIDALKIMAEKNLGVLLVTSGDKLLGIFSERDYARKIVLKGKTSAKTTVSEIMTSDVVTVSPEQSIDDCMVIMAARHIRHLPVVEQNKLVGLISILDVVKHLISEREQTIEQLKNYISGTR